MSGPAGAGPPPIPSIGQFLGALYPALGLAVGGLSLFLLLRPYLPDVYEPKRERVRLAGTGKTEDMPPELPRTLWQWASLLWHFSEEDIIRFVGADAYVFLRFLRMGFKMSLLMLVYGLGVLVPVNVYGAPMGMTEFERYSMANVQHGSPLLWAHWVGAHLFSLLFMHALYKEYQVYVDLRQQYMRAASVQSFSIVIRDIPSDVGRSTVERYLRNLLGEDCLALHLVEAPAKYDQLVKDKDSTLFKLEAAREKFEKTGVRPQHKTGCLGLWGARVDSLDTYTNKLADVNARIAELQSKEGEFQHAAVATFESVRVATAFRTIPLQKYVRFLHVTAAPAPNDVSWGSLGVPALFRGLRYLVVLGVVFFIIFCYVIPVGFVASLANLRALSRTKGLEFLQPVVESNPKFVNFLQGFVPPLVLVAFFALVPTFMLLLARLEAHPAESDCQTAAISKVFAFVLVDNFLAYTFAGAVLAKIDLLEHLAGHPVDLIKLLATTLPAQSTFFMNLIMIGALNGLTMEMLRLWPLIQTKLCRKLLASSKWDHLRVMTEDAYFQQMYAFPMLVLMAGVCYSVLAPVILVFVLVYFGLGYCVWLNQLLYVYNVPSHTGGSQFPVVFRCCMLILVMSQLLVTGVLALNGMTISTTTMAPLIALTVVFGAVVDGRFRRVGSTLTLEELLQVDVVPLQPDTIKHLKQAYKHRQDPGCAKVGELGPGEDRLSPVLLQALTEPYSVTTDGELPELSQQLEELKEGDQDDEELGGRGGRGAMMLKSQPAAGSSVEEEEAAVRAAMKSVAGLSSRGGEEEVKSQ